MNIYQRFKAAKAAFKGYGASFITDSETGRSYNALSSELKDLQRVVDAITGKHSDSNLITLFHCVPEIFAPVHAIASRVADGLVQVKMTKDDSVVYDNKPLNKLLATPNPLQNFKELVYEWVVYELVTGKNFLYANCPDTLSFDYKNIATLLNLWADRVELDVYTNPKYLTATQVSDLIKAYKLDGYSTPIPSERVLFSRRLSLDSVDYKKLEGKSPLKSADKAIANLIAVYEARNVIYVKRGALGLIVSKKGDGSGLVSLLPKEKQAIQEEFQQKYGLNRKKSPVAISDAPVDFIRIAMSIAELEPFKETQADALAIASVLGVDKDLLPMPEGTTFENKKGAERSLYYNVAIPTAKRIMQSLTNFLKLEEVGLYLDVSFDHIEVLQENKKEKSEAFKNNVLSHSTMYEKGVITKNQWLIGCGFEPIAGGDVFVTDIKNDTPLAVRLGVGGTQALTAVLADPNLSEDQKRNILVIVFNIAEDQARVMSAGGGANTNTGNSGNQNQNPGNEEAAN